VALILAVLTMSVGNLLAVWQDNIRRLLAYSSIAHGGYMLIGLAAAFGAVSAGGPISVDGIAALLFYLAVYVIATTGTFAALVYLGQPDRQIDGVDELAGLGRTHPWAGLAMAVFMFSLAGIPPLAGFWGKLTLFASALGVDGGQMGHSPLRPWFISLAVIGVLNAAVAAAYYLRVIGLVYFRSPVSQLKAQGGNGACAAMLISAVLVVLLGCYPAPLVDGSNAASQSARIDAAHPAKGVANAGVTEKARLSAE
jgi:NADH-quinone oxidoreductase subunit N